ncbi:MAG TPA: hypothetical protein VK843_04870 [Planctomycetota bacterium]|nr:hypothetical protein [Planctomycetota bacterium]
MSNEVNLAHEGEAVHQLQKSELSQGIIGIFDAPHAANQAFECLLQRGHQPNEIGIMIAEETKKRFYLPSLLTHPLDAPETTLTPEEEEKRVDKLETRAVMQGAGAVSAVGALGGLIVAATAAVIVPGLGLLLLGPLAGLGAGFGAYVGGVYAVPAIEADHAKQMAQYEAEVKAGKVLIHVTPRDADDEREIRKQWDRIRGVDSSAS